MDKLLATSPTAWTERDTRRGRTCPVHCPIYRIARHLRGRARDTRSLDLGCPANTQKYNFVFTVVTSYVNLQKKKSVFGKKVHVVQALTSKAIIAYT